MSESTPPTLAQVNTIFIEYPRLQKLLRDILECVEMSKLGGEPQCVTYDGVTGAGKTMLALRLVAQFPRYDTPNGTVVPVFYVETPSPVTVKGMASCLLAALGDPDPFRGTQPVLEERLVGLLKKCKVWLMIFDDFHHLIDSETDTVLAKVSDWLKVLIKKAGIPVLVVGIEGKVERILKANSQLSRLFAVRETLTPFQWDVNAQDTIQDFNAFVATAEQGLGIPLTQALPRHDLLYRVYYATDGVVSNVMNLLRGAMTLAREAGQTSIELLHLAKTFDKRLAKHLSKRDNPFQAPPEEPFSQPTPPPQPSGPKKLRNSRREKSSPSAAQTLSAK